MSRRPRRNHSPDFKASRMMRDLLLRSGFAGVGRRKVITLMRKMGKGCWRDNVVIERFWRTVKYEEVYLRAYETTSEARKHLHEYIAFYNTGRGHQALEYKTPDEVYFVNQVAALAA